MKIVSLSPAVTETLVELGVEDEIVGVSPYCSPWLNERKEVVGSYVGASLKRLKELRPDLIFLQSQVQDELHRKLKGEGLNSCLVPLPSSVCGIIQNVVYVGSVVWRYLESKELAARITERLNEFLGNLKEPPERRVRVYVEYLWPNMSYCTAGSLTFVDDGVWWAGGLNVFHDKASLFFTPLDEEIRNRYPDMVLVNVEPDMEISLEKYVKTRGFHDLRAFKGGKLKLVPESRKVNLAHSGPSFIETVVWLSDLLERSKP